MLHNCATSCDNVQKAILKEAKELAEINSFFDLSAEDIHGNMIDFNQFRGKGREN
jgi:hypothetical protein